MGTLEEHLKAIAEDRLDTALIQEAARTLDGTDWQAFVWAIEAANSRNAAIGDESQEAWAEYKEPDNDLFGRPAILIGATWYCND